MPDAPITPATDEEIARAKRWCAWEQPLLVEDAERLIARIEVEKAEKEELARRIADARHEIGCVLWSDNVLREGGPKLRKLRKSRDNFIHEMIVIADGLAKGFAPLYVCEACGKPIEPGQPYAHDAEAALSFHPACSGLRDDQCARQETLEERHAFNVENIERARAALAKHKETT